MHALIPDLKKLTRFYFGLENDLAVILSHSEKDSEPSLSESILSNRTRLAQIERMHAHILQLSEDLKRSRNSLDAETRQEADALATEAKSSAIRIRTLCARASEILETSKYDLLKELEEIRKGKQYLKNSNPVKTNYPKFIDSTG
jgi:hypothetical protein